MKTTLLNLVKPLRRYKSLAIMLAVIGIFGYTAYQVSLITSAQPDEAYIEAQKATNKSNIIKLDTKSLSAVANQQALPLKPDLSNVGKSDPFAP